jgi:hypothetical protein
MGQILARDGKRTYQPTQTHSAHTIWFQQPTSFFYGEKSRQTKDAVYSKRNTGALSRKLVTVHRQYLIPQFCVCSHFYPARKVHGPYCIIIRGLTGSTIRHDFWGKKMFLNIKCVFWFSLQLLSENFLLLRRFQRDIVMYVQNFCQIFMKLTIFSTDFLKISNTRFHENPSIGSRGFSCRQMDGQMGRHNDSISRFSQFCERANSTSLGESLDKKLEGWNI